VVVPEAQKQKLSILKRTFDALRGR
jgi:hypothetical protein